MAQFSLEQALDQTKRAIESQDWTKAERILRAVLGQVPPHATRLAFANLIHLLVRQNRVDEASHLLHERLSVQPVQELKRGSPGCARVAILFGLQHPDFIIHTSGADHFQFEINSGHFKVVDVIEGLDCDFNQVFLAPGQDISAIANQLTAPDLVINTIADAELEGRSLERAGRLLQRWNCPVINSPRMVAPTGRDEIFDQLRKIRSLVIPETVRWQQRADHPLPEDRFDWNNGVLARAVGTQTALHLECHPSPDSIQNECEHTAGSDLFLTQFYEFRSPDGYYRKYRLFVIDGKLYPEHLIVCDQWNIHSTDRLRIMTDQPALQEEEQAFLQKPKSVLGAKNFKALQNLATRFQLDYFGIDFTLLPDGRPLIFETNPAMRINLDYGDRFPYQKPAIDAIIEAFRSMITNRIAAR